MSDGYSVNKKQVINELLQLWEEYGYLRLGQLICCAINYEQEAFLFYCEDKVLVNIMRNNMKKGGKGENK